VLFWAGRKAAFPAVAAYLTRLLLHGRHHPARGAELDLWMLTPNEGISAKYGLRVANCVFNAGDGNLHPLRDPLRRQQARRTRTREGISARADILRLLASRSAAF